MTEQIGGRIFFSNMGRTFGEEDELCVLSVGVDIGSSTSHLVFSRIVLERLDSRYVVTERESFYQSDILLTPYAAEDTIDAAALGLKLEPGVVLAEQDARTLAASMADRLFEAMRGGSPRLGDTDLLRLDPLHWRGEISDVSFSGGVSEYIYGGEAKSYGDLGRQLAAELRARLDNDLPLARPEARIRATVIGAAQDTLQVPGSTIFVSPMETLPLRNVPVIAPALPLDGDKIEPAAVPAAIRSALKRRGLGGDESPVALFVPWRGSATFQRLDDFCRGMADGLAAIH